MSGQNAARLRAEKVSRERAFWVPKGHLLCACEPIEVTLDACRSVALQGTDVARHAGLTVTDKGPSKSLAKLGELSGAVVLASVHTSAEVTGWSWPTMSKLQAWRHTYVHITVGDVLRLWSHKQGTVMVWPFVVGEVFVVPTEEDLSARGLWEVKA